jgi:phospho-N-acetylmuramoyl-pentapeptide-transferase
MIPLIIAVIVSLISSLILTPLFIKYQTKKQIGQFVRQDGPQSHFTKRGTPTMGGVVIIFSIILGYASYALYNLIAYNLVPSISSVLLISLIITMGLIGFVDDFKKIKQEQSEGLNAKQKFALQILFASFFAILSIILTDENGIQLADFGPNISELLTSSTFLGIVLLIAFVIWTNFLIASWTNAVNLTDGLDGLASGSSIFAFGSYILICFWQSSHNCFSHNIFEGKCYTVSHPFELGVVAATVMASCIGFLWFNTSPAKIFMGDTGSLALGGAFAGLSVFTNTEFIAIAIGFIFLMEVGSAVIQVFSFRVLKRRAFKMAPIHHHFELKGWPEIQVVVRFWIIAILSAAIGLGIFYMGWIIGW